MILAVSHSTQPHQGQVDLVSNTLHEPLLLGAVELPWCPSFLFVKAERLQESVLRNGGGPGTSA